jgi:hypothetical protein
MRLNSDFDDLLSALSSEQVRYLVVGAYAVMEHTEPRYTKDLDIWVEPSPANAARVFRALKRFGAPLKGIAEKDFTNEALVYQAGVEPARFDILMKIEGVAFAQAWKRRKRTRWGRRTVNVLSVEDLIANKKRVGRPADLLDVERLQPVRRRR